MNDYSELDTSSRLSNVQFHSSEGKFDESVIPF